LLLGLKNRVVYGRAAFLDHFVTSGENNAAVAEFRQTEAYLAALAGALDWRTALSIIRSTYARGTAGQMMRIFGARGQTLSLPVMVAQEILANAKEYPVQLWDIAEGVASMDARKAVRPVWTVARKDRWFP
jgi:hypothetical protein